MPEGLNNGERNKQKQGSAFGDPLGPSTVSGFTYLLASLKNSRITDKNTGSPTLQADGTLIRVSYSSFRFLKGNPTMELIKAIPRFDFTKLFASRS
ncbi:hypothetical protein L596_018591 [Steinernema carpocapsae]|uniref:Uncharacterized protein n=1 Tax=Steinernema carpocapsae TaxID=34508 RepID=A0A4U5N5L3_STECR|nr:hypothetical protein L596_018591 [Steinernema carpocapsae]